MRRNLITTGNHSNRLSPLHLSACFDSLLSPFRLIAGIAAPQLCGVSRCCFTYIHWQLEALKTGREASTTQLEEAVKPIIAVLHSSTALQISHTHAPHTRMHTPTPHNTLYAHKATLATVQIIQLAHSVLRCCPTIFNTHIILQQNTSIMLHTHSKVTVSCHYLQIYLLLRRTHQWPVTCEALVTCAPRLTSGACAG